MEYLGDRVRVHYHFNQPDNWSNDDTLDVLYDSVAGLPPLPEWKSGEELPIHECNKTIVLVPESTREPATSSGCRSWCYTVYLK